MNNKIIYLGAVQECDFLWVCTYILVLQKKWPLIWSNYCPGWRMLPASGKFFFLFSASAPDSATKKFERAEEAGCCAAQVKIINEIYDSDPDCQKCLTN